MAHAVKGVIARGKGQPVEMVTVLVPDPGPGEALVQVQACGVCHTDLHYREGGINDDFPFLLGHEAAGIVEAVGPDVVNVKPGDFVVLNWRAVCGTCRSCLRGKPQLCFNTFNAKQKMTTLDGEVLTPILGIGTFCTHTLVHSHQCVPIADGLPPEQMSLIGCGVMTGGGRERQPLDIFADASMEHKRRRCNTPLLPKRIRAAIPRECMRWLPHRSGRRKY